MTDETTGSGHQHGYIHQKDEYLRRLRRIEGQARGLQRMVDDWYRLGVVTEQPGPGDPAFPPIFKVETDSEFPA